MKRSVSISGSAAFLCFLMLLWGCGDSGSTTRTYSVGGTITDLSGTLTLRINSGNILTRTANGSFTFNSVLNGGAAYSVTVSSQPSGQTCSVTNGSGTISTANITNVQVDCTDIPYTVGGAITGLSGSVVLQNNGGDDRTLTADGSFSFDKTLIHEADYTVTVLSQPSGQTCSVTNGSGAISAANVTNVQVDCTDNVPTGYFLDGPVEGLRYSTATKSGYTDSNGAFHYASGEVVSFYVGDTLVGQAEGAAEITPFDLAGITPPQTNLEIVQTMNEIDRNPHGTPFEVAANIAVFLQTLDSDGVSSNGIQIPNQVHALASGLHLDFSQKMPDFRDDFGFRHLVGSGRDAGLWGGSRAIENTGYALNILYDNLGIVADIRIKTAIAYDYNLDGTANSISTFTYDADSNLTAEERDYGADDTMDWIHTFAYDDDGDTTFMKYDDNADGTLNVQYEWAYDDNGNLVVDAHTDPSSTWRYLYTYNSDGSLTVGERDNNMGGPVNLRSTYTYNADGNLTALERDYNVNGTIDTSTEYTYDADGNLSMLEYDRNGDGIVDARDTYTNGNPLIIESDADADGVADMRITSTHDANGNRTLLERYDIANDTVVVHDEWTYDVDNNLTLESYDDSRGFVWISYAYDADGNLTQREQSTNGDGTADLLIRYAYDADGNLAVEEVFDATGAIIDRVTYYYQTGGSFMYFIPSPFPPPNSVFQVM